MAGKPPLTCPKRPRCRRRLQSPVKRPIQLTSKLDPELERNLDQMADAGSPDVSAKAIREDSSRSIASRSRIRPRGMAGYVESLLLREPISRRQMVVAIVSDLSWLMAL